MAPSAKQMLSKSRKIGTGRAACRSNTDHFAIVSHRQTEVVAK